MTVSLVTPDAWNRFTPTLAAYARTALSLVQPAADAHILDVAAGVLHGLRVNLGDGEVRYLQTAICGIGARPEQTP